MKHLYIIVIFLLFPSIVFAQGTSVFSVYGKVTDQNGIPIPNAVVVLDSSSIYTETDTSGTYMLKNIPTGIRKINIHSMAYHSQSFKITGQKNESVLLNFTMEEDTGEDEVVIKAKSEKELLEESANAVYVVDLEKAKLQTADMGDVLAQTQGVSVRRSGGLGSATRFSLNGLTGDQVRFFLDGIPLEYSGYSFGIATVPVNLIERVEIYKGVVPVQFGADALGGAVNIVSPSITSGLHGSLSYQAGSFGTQRVTADIKYLNDSTGFFVSGGGFYDYAKNNYKVDVEVPNEKGKLQPATVRRFHDGYEAGGLNLTIGVKDRSWAKELSIRTFYSAYTKEVQHASLSMDGIPYGDVMTQRKSAGANLVYRQNFGRKFSVDFVSGYNYSERQFIDTSHCVYDWYGNCIVVKINPGEVLGNVTSRASHQYTWDKNIYSRFFGVWKISDNHTIRLSIAPTYTHRTGREQFNNTYDPAAAVGNLLNWVNGIEYKVDAFYKLENIFFVKDYLQKVSIKEPMPGLTEPLVTERSIHYYGLGNGVRYKFTHNFSVKASYEYATRLPRPDELFGDGQFISNNMDLKPERSHNINLEFAYKSHAKAKWYIQPNFFMRRIKDLIFLNIGATDGDNVYQNIVDAVSTGVEFLAGWTSQNDKLSLNFNTTYQKYYNNSEDGLYGAFYTERIPNMPYFFANAGASYSFKNILLKNSQLNPFWNMRYIHNFYNSWESAGSKDSKKTTPSQQVQSIGLTYKLKIKEYEWAVTGEVQNLFDQNVYDFYRIQKPGRAFYVKLILQF